MHWVRVCMMGSAFYLTWCKKCVNCWGSIESIPLLTTRRLMSWLNGLTLIDMLARRVERNGRDWDTQLPYVLFAYRASLQESPFFLMHGRDPRLHSRAATVRGNVPFQCFTCTRPPTHRLFPLYLACTFSSTTAVYLQLKAQNSLR